jgi:hypothetical protein
MSNTSVHSRTNSNTLSKLSADNMLTTVSARCGHGPVLGDQLKAFGVLPPGTARECRITVCTRYGRAKLQQRDIIHDAPSPGSWLVNSHDAPPR